MEWLSREEEEIKYCDILSKDFDSSDNRISRKDFKYLWEKYGPF